MDRLKMALGMVVGAILLHMGFMACSAQSSSGLPSGSMFDTGVLGGRDARAQEMPCTRWEVRYQEPLRGGPTQTIVVDTAQPVEPGWEPFASTGGLLIARRCVAR